MDTARYVCGLLVVLGMPPAIFWWFLVHPFVDAWRRRGVRTTLVAVTAVQVVLLLLLFLIRDRLLLIDYGFQWPLSIAALTLAAVSGAVAMQRRKQLSMRTLVGVPELESEGTGQLIQSGIYARTRNPRYLEVIGFTWAYALFSNHLGPYLMATACIPLIHLVVLMEEKELLRRFGQEYLDYCDRVPRYLPVGGHPSERRPELRS